MKKFIYVMFEDVERVVECPARVCRIIADILGDRVNDEGWYEDAKTTKATQAAWHLFAYHAIKCETQRDVLNLALAHKVIVEEGQDWVEAYERIS